MNRLTSYRGTLQASVSELPIRTDRKLSRHERSMLRLYIAAYKARCDDPYALYADSLRPGRALSKRTRRTTLDPALAAPYGETGPVHGEERAVQKARRLALSCEAARVPPVRGGADFAADADYSVIEERVLAHTRYAAPWRRSKRPYIRYNGFDFEVYSA